MNRVVSAIRTYPPPLPYWLVEDEETGVPLALCCDHGMAERIAVALEPGNKPEET